MIEKVGTAKKNSSLAEHVGACSVDDVRDLIESSLMETSLSPIVEGFRDVLSGGKMLRARLVLRIGSVTGVSRMTMLSAGAAIEMMHAASLLHDDVIDGGELRRGNPAFWVRDGVSGAILLGDLLVCRAINMLADVERGSLVLPFVKYAGEMCDAEAEQELVLRGRPTGWDDCVSIARRKTGSLFAFAAYAGAANEQMGAALSWSGYALGTAYQLADDILDAYGNAAVADKTLGQDADRLKGTAASAWQEKGVDPRACVVQFCRDAEKLLAEWPEVQDALRTYVKDDIGPAIREFLDMFPVEALS